jgi:hypothetical protein
VVVEGFIIYPSIDTGQPRARGRRRRVARFQRFPESAKRCMSTGAGRVLVLQRVSMCCVMRTSAPQTNSSTLRGARPPGVGMGVHPQRSERDPVRGTALWPLISQRFFKSDERHTNTRLPFIGGVVVLYAAASLRGRPRFLGAWSLICWSRSRAKMSTDSLKKVSNSTALRTEFGTRSPVVLCRSRWPSSGRARR